MITSTKTVLLAVALSAGGLMAGPAQASAASHTPEGVCGPGFGRVSDSSRPVKTSSGKVWGYVYLLYNRTTGYRNAGRRSGLQAGGEGPRGKALGAEP